jgi:predicted chitinase
LCKLTGEKCSTACRFVNNLEEFKECRYKEFRPEFYTIERLIYFTKVKQYGVIDNKLHFIFGLSYVLSKLFESEENKQSDEDENIILKVEEILKEVFSELYLSEKYYSELDTFIYKLYKKVEEEKAYNNTENEFKPTRINQPVNFTEYIAYLKKNLDNEYKNLIRIYEKTKDKNILQRLQLYEKLLNSDDITILRFIPFYNHLENFKKFLKEILLIEPVNTNDINDKHKSELIQILIQILDYLVNYYEKIDSSDFPNIRIENLVNSLTKLNTQILNKSKNGKLNLDVEEYFRLRYSSSNRDLEVYLKFRALVLKLLTIIEKHKLLQDEDILLYKTDYSRKLTFEYVKYIFTSDTEFFKLVSYIDEIPNDKGRKVVENLTSKLDELLKENNKQKENSSLIEELKNVLNDIILKSDLIEVFNDRIIRLRYIFESSIKDYAHDFNTMSIFLKACYREPIKSLIYRQIFLNEKIIPGSFITELIEDTNLSLQIEDIFVFNSQNFFEVYIDTTKSKLLNIETKELISIIENFYKNRFGNIDKKIKEEKNDRKKSFLKEFKNYLRKQKDSIITLVSNPNSLKCETIDNLLQQILFNKEEQEKYNDFIATGNINEFELMNGVLVLRKEKFKMI